MFYAHFVLAKKGPLARIWLAAHWDKKLTKAHVFETNIEKSVDGILQPKVKMALRTSGHLLLGVVRIYSRKAKYLLADCNEAFVKIKMAFRPGMVDLPEEHREAAVTAITLPEVFHDFDSAMPELNDVDIEAQFCMNQSRAEEITMREDFTNVPLTSHDDGFGDMGFENEQNLIDRGAHSLDQSLDQTALYNEVGSVDQIALPEREKSPQPSTSAMEIDAPIRDDGFGGDIDQDITAGGLFEDNFLGDDHGDVASNLLHSNLDGAENISAPEKSLRAVSAREADSDDDMGDRYDGAPSPPDSSHGDSRPGSPLDSADLAPQMMPPPELIPAATEPSFIQRPEEPVAEEGHDHEQENEHPDQTTLLQNEEESFALAPVDASALKGVTKTKRKRKLIVDETKNISGEEMKAQLSDTSDILTTLDLAPPTKRLMHWKETGGVEKLFALPGRPIPARVLFKSYQRHLTSKAAQNEDHGVGDDRDPLPLDNMDDLLAPASHLPPPAAPVPAPMDTRRGGRKRKLPDAEEAMPPAQRKAVEEEEEEEAAIPMAPEVPLPVNQMVENHHSLMEPPQTPLPNHMDPQAAGGQLSVPPSYHDPHTPAQSFVDPHSVHSYGDISGPTRDASLHPSSLSLDASAVAMPPSHSAMHANSMGPAEIPTAMPEIGNEQLELDLLLDNGTLENGTLPTQTADVSYPAPQDSQLSHQDFTSEQQSLMENVGYDAMTNMGYDGHGDHGDHHPAMTPGAISERGPNTPWNDDYEFPHSAGPPEEQQTDETYEQFEERVLNKRAAHMYSVVKNKLAKNPNSSLYLSEMTQRNNQKQAAQKFYTLLVLKKHQVLELQQEYSYGEILVTKGKKFDNPSL